MSFSWVPQWVNPFLDRDQVMKDMAAWIETCRDQGRATLMYVHGLEGLGVSSLVAQFAKTYRDLIGGPLIWLRGRDPDGAAVPVGELLNHALRSLEVSDSDQQVSVGQKIALFNAACRGEKFVLVLDEMDSYAQILSLTPNDAPGAVIIATSSFEQRDLTGDHGFEPFSPELLTDESAQLLFRHGLRQTADEVDAATQTALLELCGGLPLQIKLLAAQLRGRARLARPLLARLQRAEVSLLEIGSERRISRFLDATYASTEPAYQAVYRLLAVVPATDFSPAAAAAALDADPDETAWALGKLAELHLLTEVSPGRYAFHPLLRNYARARAEATDDDDLRREVVRRWVDWCLRAAIPPGRALSGRWWVAPVAASAAGYYPGSVPVVSRDDGLAWFDSERPNLVAAVRAAHRHGHHDEAWQLCIVMWKYLHLHGFYEAWIETHEAGLDSAQEAGSDIGVMQLSQQLGAAYLATGRIEDAQACFHRFLTYAQQLGHAIGEQSALEWLGKTAARAGDYHRAQRFYQRSWAVTVAASDDAISPADKERVFALLRLQRNRARADAGRLEGMVDDIRPALNYFEEQDNETDNVAKARLVLGRALLEQGDAAGAEAEFATAARHFEQERATREQAGAEFWRAKALEAARRREEALTSLDLAESLYLELGDRRADEVAAFRDGLSD
ncbi:hypothetical protein FEK35_30350 [Nocardia cyriacigeorgica]|uniref:Uncharacterized protein n=1 Tax=Nocardia cyriacigeorgica TaxID=135487 RepID=A0A5R8P525_9NOCA|nr:NB-ARC domain-containing protein [Nocardia cyriacigeorgica]TLF92479.1 hypothetical protein FEK35_30350 [Nocardia cyriacigeorgica]